MKSQQNPYRSSFLSTYFKSPWRLALIAPLVFGVAAVLGYSATATAPTLLKKVIGSSTVHTPVTDPVPVHPVGHLFRVANVFAPEVFTDKPNYQPGQTAFIFGSGFASNELITLQVVHLNGTAEGGEGHEAWNVMADEFGNFTSTWFVNPDDSAGSMFLLTAIGNSSGLTAEYVFSDGSANLDTCANGPTSAPVQCTGENWDNGNLNASKSHYAEGDSVPYRTVFENLVIGNTYSISIEYDTTQGGKHAFDYLTSFDRTEPTPGNNPCTQKQGGSIVTICNPLSFVTTPIPLDPNVAAGQDQIPGNGDDITQIAGVFTLYNGNTMSIVNPGAPYTLSGSYAGNSSTEITVQFTATAATAVLAWSGHISTRLNWGLANSAIAISGSPYHMRLTDIVCSGVGEQCNVGQQDHQLAASAVFFPIQLTIIKETNPDDAQTKQFNYTTTGNNLGPFSLTPPNGTTPVQQVFNLTDTTARTVTESDPHATAPEFNLTNLSCTQTDGGLGVGSLTTNLGTRTVSFTPNEGQFISCTFTNTEDFTATRGKIIVDKVTNPSGDPTSFDFTTTYGSPFSLTDAATPNDSGQVLMPGTYQVSETANPNYVTTATCTSSKGDPADDPSSINLSAGEVVTCTFTNTKRGKIIVEKQTNPDGAAGSFTFTGDAAGSISDGGQITVNNVAPGTYTSTESDPTPAFDLTSIACDDGASATPSTTSLGTRTATFKVDPGETVKCTFTNTKKGHIIVDKVTLPGGDPQSFNFDASGGSYADFSLTDAAPPNDQTLVPGNYSVSETVPSGWDQTNTQCVSSIGDTETAGALELDAGETITCTFTNTKRGHIIVDKVTNPSGDPQSFNFDASGGSYTDFSLTDAAPPNDQTLVPGNYSVSETVPSGWDLTSSPCVSSIGDSETVGALELDPGETITCTFTNTKRGHIIVDKVTNPSGDPTSFNFDASGGSYADFSLTDAAPPNDQTLVPGNYSVSETVPSGWDLASSPCVSSIGDTESAAALELDPGETITCTFNNTKRGHIVVDKVTTPSGDPKKFYFDASGGSYADFSLTDADTPNDQTLVPGNYSVSETVPSGWDLTNTQCVSSIGDTETAAALELDAGETITCTFTNTKRGHIVVDKVTNPSGDPQSFNFDANGGSYADFSLTDAAPPNDQTLVPGNYSVSETTPAGWDLTNTQCDSSIGDTETAGALELDAGETITCTFTNTKRGHIIVDKITNPSGDPQSFNFDANGGSYADFSLTDAAPPNDQTLVPGSYSVSETVPTGWDLTSSPCTSSLGHAETAASITLNAGETVTCKFYNRKRANLIVEKQTNPDGASGSFTFTGTAAGTIGDGGTIPVNNLVPGTYTSTENNPAPNFDLTSISCNDANSTGDVPSRTATFRLEPGETVKCTFTNTQRGMAQVVKTVSGVAPPAGQSFTFELRQGASTVSDGTVLESKNTDASGNISFTTKLAAGQTYQICEWVFPGWNTNLAGDGPLFVPNSMIPPALPNPNVNNLTVCADFTVQPGQTRTFTVDNTPPPGGRALTIGFWKNWSSCSNSNGKGQKPMLDLALGIASATTTNPPGGLVVSAQNPGALWPNYAAIWYLVVKGNATSTPNNIKPAPDCSIAVNLLDKSTSDGKKKMSSDPLFNMTAQLLAAQLNRFMGAGINGTTIMNIDRAVLLNGKYKFNGLTYTPKLTTADANTANCLATQLDNYNNGRPVGLCP
jgi:plastocyanin